MHTNQPYHVSSIASIFAATTILLLTASPVFAQRQPPGRHGQRADETNRPERPREHVQAENRQGRQWLQEFAASNPEAFQQAQALRQEDPEAFALWIRTQMAKHRRNTIVERHPAFKSFLETLPDAERDALEHDLFQAPRGQRVRGDRQPGAPQADSQRMPREPINPERFDARTKHLENELAQAEERIQQLRQLLQKRNEMRERILQE